MPAFGGKSRRKGALPEHGPERTYASSGAGFREGYWRSSRPRKQRKGRHAKRGAVADVVVEEAKVPHSHKVQASKERYNKFWLENYRIVFVMKTILRLWILGHLRSRLNPRRPTSHCHPRHRRPTRPRSPLPRLPTPHPPPPHAASRTRRPRFAQLLPAVCTVAAQRKWQRRKQQEAATHTVVKATRGRIQFSCRTVCFRFFFKRKGRTETARERTQGPLTKEHANCGQRSAKPSYV